MTNALGIDLNTEPTRSRRNHWNNQCRRHAQMTPDKPALKFMGEVTTWSELDARTPRLAAALRRRGVGFGDRILVLMLNRSEYVELVFAANLLGAIPVPVNIRMAPPEIGFIVQDSGSTMIVTESLLAPLADAVAGMTGIENVIVLARSISSFCPGERSSCGSRRTSYLPGSAVPSSGASTIM